MTTIFTGDRSEYKKWAESLTLAWLAKGVNQVATNAKERPVESATHSKRKEKDAWDHKNEQALAILLERFDPDLRIQAGPLQSSKCYRVYRYMNETYGGAHDVTAIAHHKKLAKTELQDNQTLEIFIGKFNHHHREAGTDTTNGPDMLADLVLVLENNKKTEPWLNHCRVSNLNYTQTCQHLISEDRFYRLKAQDQRDIEISRKANTSTDLKSVMQTSITKPPCFNMMDKGECYWGKDCRFSHDKDIIDKAISDGKRPTPRYKNNKDNKNRRSQSSDRDRQQDLRNRDDRRSRSRDRQQDKRSESRDRDMQEDKKHNSTYPMRNRQPGTPLRQRK